MYTFSDVPVGAYDPGLAGLTVSFVARDADGLPIVSETINGCKSRTRTLINSPDTLITCATTPTLADPRVDAFQAELHWLGPMPPPAGRMPIQFMGNRMQDADGSWVVVQSPPRRQDGKFRVTVSLTRTGLHALRIKGPPADGSSLKPVDYLPWEVHILGICPAGQVSLTDPDWRCGCQAGAQPSGGYGSAVVACQQCPNGELKELDGNFECYSCLEAITRIRGDVTFASKRTVTYSEASTDIHQCGCSTGFFLSHIDHAIASQELSTVCPPLSADGFEEQTAAFRKGCCNASASSDCKRASERLCLSASCKSAHLATVQQSRLTRPNVSGVCQPCSVTPQGLLMEGAKCEGGMHVIERLVILPGFWRANELSEVLRPCITTGACVGTSEPREAMVDNLCAANRQGPYCEVCFPSFYKDDMGNW